MSQETELLLNAVFVHLLNGEEEECEKALSTMAPNELHELRRVASQLRGLTINARRQQQREK